MADTASPPDLPASAQPAWQAWEAMVESKAAHLALLQRCQEQRDQGLSPSIAEQLHLESLLAEHDRRVQVFSAALKVLKTTDPDVMPRLLALMR